jgi:hypothetical protein
MHVHIGNMYRILVIKPAGKRPLWRCRGRWEGSIEVDLKRNRM